MAKVYLDPGHGGYDAGAVKYVTEKTVNLNMALACRDYLQANGVTVKMSRTTDKWVSLSGLCREANAWGANLAVSIHNNAGGGDGFEVYHHYGGGKGKILALNIEAEVKKIGQNSRGLKTKRNSSGTDYFGFIRLTSMPAVICEGAFVDNWNDSRIIDTLEEQKAFGYAYARGILKTLGVADKGFSGNSKAPTPTTGSTKLVVDGVWGTNTSKKLQKYLGVTQDGIFGIKSITALQRWVGTTQDGVMGPKTVTALQKKLGVTQDGICGPKTVKALQTFLNTVV